MNINKSQYDRDVLIYTKKCLKAVAINFSELDYREYGYGNLSSKNSGLLHTLCIYGSSNSRIENHNNHNSLITKFSKLNGYLLILGDFQLGHVGYTPQQRKLCYKISYSYPKLFFALACK